MPIKITPREPLTRKAKGAIEEYAFFRCGDLQIAGLLIKFTLEAERMKRDRLYSYLEDHGFNWIQSHGYWRKPLHGQKPN